MTLRKPQPTQRFTARLSIKVTPDQLQRWRQAGRADGRDLSNWVRWVLDQEAEMELSADQAESDMVEGLDSERESG